MSNMAKLEVKNLTISFRTNNGAVRAVRNISFNLNEGETLAIAGESGSGKSVTTRAVMGILAGNAMVDNGEIIYDGKDLLKISEDDFHTLRGHKLAMVFQDPLSALNPIMRIGRQLTEAMILNNKERRADGKLLFNRTLARLEKAMIEEHIARNVAGDVKGMIQKKVKEFDAFNVCGIKMENAYLQAKEEMISALDCIEEIEINILKKEERKVRETIQRLLEACNGSYDLFLIRKDDQEFQNCLNQLKNIMKSFTLSDTETLKGICETLKSKLSAANEGTLPNFFCLGYYTMHGGEVDPRKHSVEEMNAAARKALDDGFMIDFLQDVEKALIYSEKQNAVRQQKAVEVLRQELPVFQKEVLNEKECRAAAKRAADAVESAIDPLKLQKDNQSYVFKSSMKANIDRYFKGVEYNPKEEKSFAKDTAKFEKLTKAGKMADAVVPLNLIDLNVAHQNLINSIVELIANYEAQLKDMSEKDYAALAVEMIDYLKARASEYAYKLSMAMARHRAIELMKEVGIPEPHKRYHQYPFELSGGMRQRIVIAIALSANPDILICDEPTTALDVTIQAQILELINRLKKERNLSVIFITHDLGVVANMADRIAIMYAGKIVEYGTADDVFYDPRHPYTWALLSSMPDLETKEKLDAIPGTPPNMIIPPKGDAFAARNHYAMQIDFEEQPPMFDVSETHQAATWLLHPDAPQVEPPAIVRERIERMKNKQAQAPVTTA